MTAQALSLPALWATFRTRIIKRKFVRDVGVLTVANGITAALSLVQGILVARWLGPELYGVAALAMTYPSLVHTFFDARSAEASVKYLSEFHAHNEREHALSTSKLGYLVDFAIASLAFLTVLCTAPWAVRWIAHRPETAGLILVHAAACIPRALVGTSHATDDFGPIPVDRLDGYPDNLIARSFGLRLGSGRLAGGWGRMGKHYFDNGNRTAVRDGCVRT